MGRQGHGACLFFLCGPPQGRAVLLMFMSLSNRLVKKKQNSHKKCRCQMSKNKTSKKCETKASRPLFEEKCSFQANLFIA